MSEPAVARLDVGPSDALELVADVAELWGGSFEVVGSGGRVVLPVQAGLRHGRFEGRIVLVATEGASRLTLETETASYWLHRPAVALLGIAALGALSTVLWPFVPGLRPLLPLGFIVAFVAWFLVIARLKNRGPSEFLATVEALAGSGVD